MKKITNKTTKELFIHMRWGITTFKNILSFDEVNLNKQMTWQLFGVLVSMEKVLEEIKRRHL